LVELLSVDAMTSKLPAVPNRDMIKYVLIPAAV
jgi:hypothetical protein